MNEKFRERLREEIQQNDLKITELAKLVGVSPEMITQYYTTKKLPKLDTFARLCIALNVSADYLLGFSDQ